MKRIIFLIMLSIASIVYGAEQLNKGTAPSISLRTGPLSERDKMGNELIKAVKNNDKKLVVSLIEKDANLNIKDEYTDRTALMIAISRYNYEIARLLIENNCNLDSQDEYGYTALMTAIKTGSEEIANLLIEKGANLNIRDGNGYTILTHAVNEYGLKMYIGHFKGMNYKMFIIKLLEKGADTTLRDNNNIIFLDYIADKEFREEIIKLITSQKETIKTQISDVIPVKDLAGVVVDYLYDS